MMKRREMLGAIGVGVGVAGLAATTALAQEPAADKAHRHDKMHEECLKACSDCAKMCDETFHHCYTQVAEGKREHAKPLHFVSDCAGFCSLSACMIAKHSPMMVHSCAACAEACHDTAMVVQTFDSPEMKAAAKALKACEASCRDMVKAMGGKEHTHKTGASK